MNLKILIVDDEIELRKSVASILQNIHLDIHIDISEASDGLAALELVKNNFYDLILMDVRMPEMNGLDALKEIKEHDPRTFVVIMTAHSNLNDAITAIKDGAYDYLEKPVSPEKLKTIIKNH